MADGASILNQLPYELIKKLSEYLDRKATIGLCLCSKKISKALQEIERSRVVCDLVKIQSMYISFGLPVPPSILMCLQKLNTQNSPWGSSDWLRCQRIVRNTLSNLSRYHVKKAWLEVHLSSFLLQHQITCIWIRENSMNDQELAQTIRYLMDVRLVDLVLPLLMSIVSDEVAQPLLCSWIRALLLQESVETILIRIDNALCQQWALPLASHQFFKLKWYETVQHIVLDQDSSMGIDQKILTQETIEAAQAMDRPKIRLQFLAAQAESVLGWRDLMYLDDNKLLEVLHHLTGTNQFHLVPPILIHIINDEILKQGLHIWIKTLLLTASVEAVLKRIDHAWGRQFFAHPSVRIFFKKKCYQAVAYVLLDQHRYGEIGESALVEEATEEALLVDQAGDLLQQLALGLVEHSLEALAILVVPWIQNTEKQNMAIESCVRSVINKNHYESIATLLHAISHYRSICERCGVSLISVLCKNKQYEEALKVLDSIMSMGGDHYRTILLEERYITIIQQLLAEKQFSSVESFLEKSSAIPEKSCITEKVAICLSECLAEDQQYHKAISILDQYRISNPICIKIKMVRTLVQNKEFALATRLACQLDHQDCQIMQAYIDSQKRLSESTHYDIRAR